MHDSSEPLDSTAHESVVRLAIVGEFDPAFPPHVAVDANIAQVSRARAIEISAEWVPTDEIARDGVPRLKDFDAIWISPGSPYKSLDGALIAIRHAREN